MKNAILILLLSITSTYSQISGCTDLLAKNFNKSATQNDGSCIYDFAKIKPESSLKLSDSLIETSGLIAFDNLLWTHNDNADTTIYGMNLDGKIKTKIKLEKAVNTDWEAITQDSNYIYIGDFGNNSQGNRRNLQILRIEKNSFLAHQPAIDTISFSYSDQTDLSIKKGNTTDYDCEAFVVLHDSIYLFTKQWTQNKSNVYALPKNPGKHIAQLKTTLSVNGLITDATVLNNEKAIILCGYTRTLQPFLYLLYDIKNYNFLTANQRKIKLALPFHQIESITTLGRKLFLTNEAFVKKPFINTTQKLHYIDLNTYIKE